MSERIFCLPEQSYFQTASVGLDIYGFGKTIQYLLSEAEIQPPLRKREEAKLKKIIFKCLNRQSKKAYTNMPDLQRDLPDYIKETTSKKNPTEKKFTHRKKVIIGLAAISLTGTLVYKYGHDGMAREPESGSGIGNEQVLELEQESVHNHDQIDEEVYIRKLGLLYFLELRDYEQSKVYFEMLEGDSLSSHLAQLAAHMTGKDPLKKQEFRDLLEQIDQESAEETTGDETEAVYRCLMRGYGVLEEEDDEKKLMQIADKLLDRQPERGVRRECVQYIARAAEHLKDWETAADRYQELLDWKAETEEASVSDIRESIYQNLGNACWQKGEKDKALEICRAGIDEYPESMPLRVQYIRMQCEDTGIDRTICAQTIKESILAQPKLREDEAFQKLMQEYGIVIEGENIWVGR